MADHNKPNVASVYDNMISEIDGRLDDIAQGFDVGTPTNMPTSAIGWKSSLNKWQKYTGSTWVDLAATYNISISGNAATATTAGSATTAGNITGTAAVANGGTGMTTYTLGDIVFASATNVLGKLASVSTGNVLLSGGVGSAPAYGKVTLTGHVSGILPVANGGTGVSTLTGLLKGNGGAAMTAATAAEIVAAIGSTAVTRAASAASVDNGAYLNVSNTFGAGTVQSVVLNTNVGIATSADVAHGIEVRGNGTGGAFQTFHRPGSFAAQFGLDTDNQWKVGGWSMGDVAYNLIHSGNLGTGLTFSSGALNCTVSGGTRNVQTFTAGGTWTKPAGAPADALAVIEVWAAGGSGARGVIGAGGGGGGMYASKTVLLSALGGTETVTIGAGGAARTTDGAGYGGGNSSFGAHLTGYGGGGGGHGATIPACPGGGGGGAGGTAGTPSFGFSTPIVGSGGTDSTMGGGGLLAGGGGGSRTSSGGPFNGGQTVNGGGGGGGSTTVAGTSNVPGGVSMNGGNGGAGGNSGASNGVVPGGGGGGTRTGTTGAGADGKIVVTVIW